MRKMKNNLRMNKKTKAQAEKKEKFGDAVTADHLVSKSDNSTAWDGSKYAAVIYDCGVDFLS